MKKLVLKIYLFMRDTHRERQRDRQREKQAPRGEPNVGLDPRTLGSCSGPKAYTQPLSYPGIPRLLNIESKLVVARGRRVGDG